jgi:hypothetical protein
MLQVDLELLLKKNEIPFERHLKLSPRDIPDFLVDGRIVLECKMHNKSSKMSIFRQLQRYAEHNQVGIVILVSNISMGLPAEVNGKPLYSASLSRGWL